MRGKPWGGDQKSIEFRTEMVTKFKSRLGSKIKTEELNVEIVECNEGQGEAVLNDNFFQPSKKTFSTPRKISATEMELEFELPFPENQCSSGSGIDSRPEIITPLIVT